VNTGFKPRFTSPSIQRACSSVRTDGHQSMTIDTVQINLMVEIH